MWWQQVNIQTCFPWGIFTHGGWFRGCDYHREGGGSETPLHLRDPPSPTPWWYISIVYWLSVVVVQEICFDHRLRSIGYIQYVQCITLTFGPFGFDHNEQCFLPQTYHCHEKSYAMHAGQGRVVGGNVAPSYNRQGHQPREVSAVQLLGQHHPLAALSAPFFDIDHHISTKRGERHIIRRFTKSADATTPALSFLPLPLAWSNAYI